MSATNNTIAILDDDLLYDTPPAASYCHVKGPTMRNSRWTGILAGVPAPAHIKIGSKVLYRGITLRKWREQFIERVKVSDHEAA